MRSWFRENADYLSRQSELAAIGAELNLLKAVLRSEAKYSPDQPRVPAGNPDGGQWTSEGDSDTTEFSAARISRVREAECEAQYKLDSALCRMVRTPLCWEQAMRRRAACISGYPLPPLNF